MLADTPPQSSTVSVDLDAVSLQQALRDFEHANARVLDLTHRLVAAEKRWRELVDEAEHLRLRLAALERGPLASLHALPARLTRKVLSLGRRLGRAVQ